MTPVEVSVERVCQGLVADLCLSGAAVELRTGSWGSAHVASTGEAARRWAGLELDLGEGPATQASREGKPVLVGDLHGPESQMWPGYATIAIEEGLGAVFALPLQIGAARFGMLTLFDIHPRRLNAVERAHVLAACAIVVDLLLDAVASSGPQPRRRLGPALEDALTLRSEVYQAQGMTMAALGVSLAEALDLMRAHCFSTGRGLDAVAIDIVAGLLVLSRDDPPADSGPDHHTDDTEDPPT